MEDLLNGIEFFSRLQKQTLHHIAALIEPRRINAGDHLFLQDDPPTGLFAIQEGLVLLYRHSDRKSQVLTVLGAGDAFGAESLSNNTPSPYAARAVVETRLLYIPPEQFRTLLDTQSDLLIAFVALASLRLQQLTALVQSLAFRSVTARLAGILLTLAQMTGEKSGKVLHLDRVLSQQDLASMAGTVREVVSRTLKKFEEDGLLEQTAQEYVLLDVAELANIAMEEAV